MHPNRHVPHLQASLLTKCLIDGNCRVNCVAVYTFTMEKLATVGSAGSDNNMQTSVLQVHWTHNYGNPRTSSSNLTLQETASYLMQLNNQPLRISSHLYAIYNYVNVKVS